ncbi:MAG: TonB-dependent receptor plug domain-containing protein [Parahaliea sp.]
MQKNLRVGCAGALALSTTLLAQAQDTGPVANADNNPKLETMTVYGKQNRIATQSMLATKSDMTLMETPAPLLVVDETLIREQGASDLQDLLRDMSGVTQAGDSFGIGDDISIRGLGANYTYDGMYGGAGLGNAFNPTRSLTNVDTVEVLKGPASVLYGIGSAGGIINLIEKKPDFNRFTDLEAIAGAWDTYSLEVDHGGVISDDIAYRLVAKSARSDGYRDVSLDRDEVYGSLRFDLGERQSLVTSLAWIDDSVQVDSTGHPIRIYNEASTGVAAGDVTAGDLVNDPSGRGVELTDSQREALAATIGSGTGLRPYDNGDTSLASPLSAPNEGDELRFKLHYRIAFSSALSLSQQLQYRNYESEFVRQTGAYNYIYWNRNGAINADPRAPLVDNGVLYPWAARRQEYRKVTAEEKSWQYFADLQYRFNLAGIR